MEAYLTNRARELAADLGGYLATGRNHRSGRYLVWFVDGNDESTTKIGDGETEAGALQAAIIALSDWKAVAAHVAAEDS